MDGNLKKRRKGAVTFIAILLVTSFIASFIPKTTATPTTVVCQVQTINLASEPVADITVEVYNATTNQSPIFTEETNETGWATFSLDHGNYTFKAFWMFAEVGSITNQSINQKMRLTHHFLSSA